MQVAFALHEFDVIQSSGKVFLFDVKEKKVRHRHVAK
jgi:hypothetical protein